MRPARGAGLIMYLPIFRAGLIMYLPISGEMGRAGAEMCVQVRPGAGLASLCIRPSQAIAPGGQWSTEAMQRGGSACLLQPLRPCEAASTAVAGLLQQLPAA